MESSAPGRRDVRNAWLPPAVDRVAPARGCFNTIGAFYNARLEIVSDRFLAALAGLKPETLMAAAGFERAPVTVDVGE